jgi:hypothetical protein
MRDMRAFNFTTQSVDDIGDSKYPTVDASEQCLSSVLDTCRYHESSGPMTSTKRCVQALTEYLPTHVFYKSHGMLPDS